METYRYDEMKRNEMGLAINCAEMPFPFFNTANAT